MKPKLAVVYLLIVLLPLGLLAGLGLRVARYERDEVRRKFHGLLLDQLNDIERTAGEFVEERERALRGLLGGVSASNDASGLREAVRRNPIISQGFLLEPAGAIVYPDPGGRLNADERRFLERAGGVLVAGLASNREPEGQAPTQQLLQQTRPSPSRSESPRSGTKLFDGNAPQPPPSLQGEADVGGPEYGWHGWF